MLVYSTGKILSDDSAIKEYKIDDKSFVVVMVTKVGIARVISKQVIFFVLIKLGLIQTLGTLPLF